MLIPVPTSTRPVLKGTIPCPDRVHDGAEFVVGPYPANPFIPTYRVVSRIPAFWPHSPVVTGPGCKPWWYARIAGYEKVLPAGGEEPDSNEYPSISKTLLKARLTIHEFDNVLSQIIVDIGSRLDFHPPPTWSISGEILMPDSTQVPTLVSPTVPADATAFTRVVAAAGLTEALLSRGFARYTQSLWLDPATQAEWDLQRPTGARSFQFYAETYADVTIQFMYDEDLLVPLGEPIVGPDTEGVHQIPQNASIIRVSQDAGAAQPVTLVFKLEL